MSEGITARKVRQEINEMDGVTGTKDQDRRVKDGGDESRNECFRNENVLAFAGCEVISNDKKKC